MGRAIFLVRPLRISPVGSKALCTVQVLGHVKCSSSRCGSKNSYWQFWFNCPVIIPLKHGAYCVPFRLDVHHYLPINMIIKIISEVELVLVITFEAG